MDPVQLMMAAHQADATVAAQTPDQALQAAIAQSRPDLWAPLSTNPAAYPDLLGWLASTGNVEVLANLRARGYLTDDAAADAAGAAGSAVNEPAVEPHVVQEEPAQMESADPAEDGDAESVEPAAEDAVDSDAEEAADGAEVAEPAEMPGPDESDDEEAGSVAGGSADEAAEDAEDAADEAQELVTAEPDDEFEDDVEDAAVDVDSDEAEGESGADPGAEPTEVDEAVEATEKPVTDELEDETSEGPAAEDAAGDEPADERGAQTAEPTGDAQATEPADATEADVDPEVAQEAADDAVDADDSGDEQKADEPVEDSAGESAGELSDNAPTVLAPVSQWQEVDSADTTDVTASAQSAAVSSGWTAGSAAPAAGSAESVALPVPPPPSAEDIAAWAETPSGAPSGFSAAQPAVELDMFGPQMMAQMPPPQQQRQPSRSSSGRLIAIIVVLLLVIVGGGGVWAGTYFANKGKSDSSQDKADGNGDKGGEQNGQADAAATSTAAALPSGAVKACSSMPTFTITSVEDGQGELKVQGNMATSCAEGDFLAGASNQVLVYSSTSPTGGEDVDHLVASGTFDLSGDPLIIPNGGRAVTLRFGEQHYFRTAKDLELKGLSVKPSFDRGSSSSVTSKSSTNSPMTVASSTSSNANQEAQDEQAAGDAIGWQVKHDYPIVMNSMRGKWTPQLSSKQVGLVAEGQTWTNRSILAEFLKTRQANPKAVIIDTSQWPVYDVGGWWVTLSGELYDDADQANAWCDAQGYDSDHCLAKRIESNGTSQGTTKTR
ncbi:hypothetical protein RMW62_02200 [Actinomyces oris]|uniref:Leucine rich repeat variant domain-containing protein n=1 Tax=Actinomyces oris TaxID=544580 RepID=A0AAE4G0F0_9ACTO|nr:hypothetical protein [Actinomyces oris]MDT0247892.1 hypothetical protein [Actinomyces oris]